MLKSLKSRQILKFFKMKIERKILTIILLSLIIFTGCKKDKKESTVNNYIRYDGTTYAIDKGYLENWGKWSLEGDNNLDLTLVSNGISVVEVGGEIDEYIGEGNAIIFYMYSTSTTRLDDGNYVYDEDATEEAGTFEWANVVINYNIEDEEGDVDQYIVDGTVTVTKTGDVYEISFNLTDEDGKTVTGYFKGTLKYYDYDKKKSTKTDKRRF